MIVNLYITDQNTSTGYRPATLDEIMTGARQALAARIRRGTVFTSPKVTADYLIARLGQLQYEVFTLIYVDSRHRFIAAQNLFLGTIDGASVHPRQVVKGELHAASARTRTYVPVRSGARRAERRGFATKRRGLHTCARTPLGRR